MDKSIIASFDVDCQKGFTPLCPNELPVPEGDEIVDALNEQAKLASIRVGSKDAHPEFALWTASEDNPQFSYVGAKNVDIKWNKHCVVGTEGFKLLDGLPNPIDYDYFVWKGIENDLHPYGACYHDLAETKSTGVIEYLKSKGIKVVIIGGLAYDYCVKTTALQLRKAGFIVMVNVISTKSISKDSAFSAMAEMIEADIHICDGFDIVKLYIEKGDMK